MADESGHLDPAVYHVCVNGKPTEAHIAIWHSEKKDVAAESNSGASRATAPRSAAGRREKRTSATKRPGARETVASPPN
jgi:hypothetical protein